MTFRDGFPLLTDVEQKKTSNPDPRYNCIAWAFKDNRRHWWPNQQRSYWPLDARGKSKLEAFQDWFAHDGWTETSDAAPEDGYEKVALYALGGEPTHAARMLPDGSWTSKLGQHLDLRHKLEDLYGPAYGTVLKIYKKPISTS